MEKSLKYFRIYNILFVFASVFLLTDCGRIIDSSEAYTGPELYESIVTDGELLVLVPGIQNEVYNHLETKEDVETFETFEKELVTGLIADNSSFAEEFHDKLHNGDREQINEALYEAGELLVAELGSLIGNNRLTPENLVNAVLENN